jgi:hypothetical protein
VYQSIIQYISQIKALEKSGFDMPATIMSFMGIDMMSRLSLPVGEIKQTKRHFKDWVNEFMQAHPDQAYQYNADDLYGARCSVIHNYTSDADIHEREPDIKKYAYHDGGQHMFDESIHDRLVLIGMKSFNNDFINGVDAFLVKIGNSDDLRLRVESRLNDVFEYMPVEG